MRQFKFACKWKPSDDQWDCDAVEYLLKQRIVMSEWKWSHAALFECLRRQPNWIRHYPDRVELAAQLARECGVEQITTGRVVHFVRHDSDAPAYPSGR